MVLEVGATDEGGEAVLPFRAPPETLPKAKRFRSTWIVSSLDGLRETGHFARYREALSGHEDAILSCIAGAWLPMNVALAHYQACEQLGLSDNEYLQLAAAGASVRRAWHASILAGAEREGATPWTVLAMYERAWSRSVDGGGVAVFRLSERKARVETVGCELLRIPYYRRASRMMVHMLAARVCKGLKAHDLPSREPDRASFMFTWTDEVHPDSGG